MIKNLNYIKSTAIQKQYREISIQNKEYINIKKQDLAAKQIIIILFLLLFILLSITYVQANHANWIPRILS